MTKTYKISRKQSLLDACIQVYGTAQLLFAFAKDNGLSIDSFVNIGDELIYNESLGVPRVKNVITRAGLDVGNEGNLLSEWILASGLWVDGKIWIDTEVWID